MRKILAGMLSFMVATALAQGVPAPPGIADLRLLPPAFRAQPPGLDIRNQVPRIPALVRERHPEVFEKAAAGTYVVLLLIDPEGRVQQSTATEVEPGRVDATMLTLLAPMVGANVVTASFQKENPLPDGSSPETMW